jgi:hypothetical protein
MVKTYVENAWEDAELRTQGEISATDTAECARAWIDDAWEDVWNAEE